MTPDLEACGCGGPGVACTCGVWAGVQRVALELETAGLTTVGRARGGRRGAEFSLRRVELGGAVRVIAVEEPVTQGRRRTDSLTGLPGREVLHEALRRAGTLGKSVAMAVIDLDRFKAINDTAGHSVGDRVLALVGQRLLGAVRTTDVVVRLGGDEFGVLLADIDSPQTAQDLLERIASRITQPLEVAGGTYTVGCSIGLALAPRDGPAGEALCCLADRAMYLAKRRGGGVVSHGEGAVEAKAPAARVGELSIEGHRLGITQLDDEHERLLRVAGDAAALAQAGDDAATRGQLTTLYELTRRHFITEELVLRAHGLATRDHQRAHRLFLSRLRLLLTGPTSLPVNVVTLADALVDHIETHDSVLAPSTLVARVG